jgi:hypothetical protein
VGKPLENRPLGRPRRRWENNSKMDLRYMGSGVEKWTKMAQDLVQRGSLVSAVFKVWVLLPQ